MAGKGQAFVVDVARQSDRLVIRVVLATSDVKVQKTYEATPAQHGADWLSARVSADLDALDDPAAQKSLEAFAGTLAPGTPIAYVAPAPPDPVDADPERLAFLSARDALDRALRIEARGLASGVDLDALRSALQKAIDSHPEFLELL